MYFFYSGIILPGLRQISLLCYHIRKRIDWFQAQKFKNII